VPQKLFRFDSPASVANWRVTTDADYGGKSTASFVYNEARQCAVFAGQLDLATAGTSMKQSGFAAITGPRYATPLDLSDFSLLRFRVRRRGGLFISNVKTDSRVEDDLFQCFLLRGDTVGHANRNFHVHKSHIVSPYAETVAPALRRESLRVGAVNAVGAPPAAPASDDDPFEIVDLPFADYAHTWRGFLEDDDNRLDPFDIRWLGVLMAERRAGPFELDLHSIEAISAEHQLNETKRHRLDATTASQHDAI